MNSKRKGKEGELELAQFLRSQGFSARRGQQFSGTPDSPDIVSDFPVHIECKVTECLQLRKAVAQAQADSGGRPWVVFHRWNRGPWIAIMSGEQVCAFAKDTEFRRFLRDGNPYDARPSAKTGCMQHPPPTQ